MYGQLTKIAIIILVTFISTSMPDYINDNVNGFLPSEEVISKNLHTDTASSSSQVSLFEVEKEVAADELIDEEKNTQNTDDNKSEAYNTKSGKVIGQVSDKAIENENPIISCDDPLAECDPGPTITPIPYPTEIPKPTLTPRPTVTIIPVPTEIPIPTVTIIPLPTKYPTIYPCPPVPVDSVDKIIEIPPCPDIYIY